MCHDLQQVLKNEIPRCYFQEWNESDTQLYVFTDASQLAYGACAYFVTRTESTLVMARNRVAPLKSITLPKWELMGAVIGAKLANYLLENLNQNSMEVNFWTDSQIVLKWMNSRKTLKPFVSNRIKEVKTQVETQTWRYVPTDSNPADLQTRGISAKAFLGNKLWMTGPL